MSTKKVYSLGLHLHAILEGYATKMMLFTIFENNHCLHMSLSHIIRSFNCPFLW